MDENDSATVDLGYVTNSAVTFRQGRHQPEDDQFSLEVEVRATDHPLNTPGSEHEIFAAVKFGDVIIVGKGSFLDFEFFELIRIIELYT